MTDVANGGAPAPAPATAAENGAAAAIASAPAPGADVPPSPASTAESAPTKGKGIEKDFHGDKFSDRQKAGALAIASAASLVAVLEGAIFTPAIYEVQQELGTTEVLSNLSIACYTVATAIAPLFWAPLSEVYGRKPVYLGSLAFCLLGSVALVFTPELGIGWLIGWRVVQGLGACAAFSVGAGTISDIYRIEQRGRAFGINSLGPLLGALIGPPIGGALSQYAGYRYVFVFTAGITAVLILVIQFFLPETLPPRKEGAKKPTLNPLAMFPTLRYPWVCIPIYAQAITWGALYSQISMLARQLNFAYGWEPTAVGLYGLVPAIGNIIGAIGAGFIADRMLNKSAGGGKVPETRLGAVQLGVALSFVGLTIFGWTIQYKIHPAVPAIANFIWGIGMMVMMTPTGTFLVDVYRPAAASISALANLLRLAVASITPLASPAMQDSMGIGGLYQFWAGLLLVTVSPAILWMTAAGWKKRLKTAPWSEEHAKQVREHEAAEQNAEKVAAEKEAEAAIIEDTV
ncbi:major facilitator superfamily domain-containing protein [Hyaloraphidium curvatum]|nr:major facilitator superfamily domain-containing protein [Hyaloraphidium curvatum]